MLIKGPGLRRDWESGTLLSNKLRRKLSFTVRIRSCVVFGYKYVSKDEDFFFRSLLHQASQKRKNISLMSDPPPVQKVPLQFYYTCMHHVSGYFRRRDGHSLNISAMMSPYDPEVVLEPLNLQADPQIRPQIRLLLRQCSQCRQLRREHIQRVNQLFDQRFEQNPERELWRSLILEGVRQTYAVEDLVLMERALDVDIRSVLERVERLLVEATPPADNLNDQSNHEDDDHDQPEERES